MPLICAVSCCIGMFCMPRYGFKILYKLIHACAYAGFELLRPMEVVLMMNETNGSRRLSRLSSRAVLSFVRDWLTTSVRRSMSALNVTLSSSLIPTKSDVMFSSSPKRRSSLGRSPSPDTALSGISLKKRSMKFLYSALFRE